MDEPFFTLKKLFLLLPFLLFFFFPTKSFASDDFHIQFFNFYTTSFQGLGFMTPLYIPTQLDNGDSCTNFSIRDYYTGNLIVNTNTCTLSGINTFTAIDPSRYYTVSLTSAFGHVYSVTSTITPHPTTPTTTFTNITWNLSTKTLDFDTPINFTSYQPFFIDIENIDPSNEIQSLYTYWPSPGSFCTSSHCTINYTNTPFSQLNYYPNWINEVPVTQVQIKIYQNDDYTTLAASQFLPVSFFTSSTSPTPTPTPTNTPTPTPTPTYSITGTVYNDDNKNGSQDTGEIGYNGATITSNTGQTATTDSNGNYTLSNLTAGSYTETLTVPNGYSATTTNPVTIALSSDTSQNFGIYSAPVVNSITAPTSPVQVNTSVSASATFTDGDTTDTQHTATWYWGDGSTSQGTITEPNGSTPGTVTGSHSYAAAGSYIVYLTVTDDDGTPATGTSPQTVVAISPSGGLMGSNLTGDNYSGANLSNQNLSNSNLKNTTFTDVNLQGANLSGVNVKSANLQNANLTGADLTNANLKGANLTNANLTGANLTGAILTGATITGITWSNTTCPDGTNSNNHNNTCIGHGGGL